jgi:Ca2+-binding EF-hand superfamily protein
MGPVTSNPIPAAAVVDFVNLPKEAIMSLWVSYNLLGEGWGLTNEQFNSIFTEAEYLKSNYDFNDDKLNKLFKAFDTDKNGLVDALEAIVSIGLFSGT